jgi:8-oxo-dGTP pyrophosphatase MutT (NUDIX family)
VARGGRRFRRDRGRRARGTGTGGANGQIAEPGIAKHATHQVESSERGPLIRDVSAGGVVYRQHEGGPIEVALVGRLHPRPRWALPKGTPEVGETLEGTAVREVGEETGLLVKIERPLDQIQYWFVWGGVRHFKTVHFYLMAMVGGDTANHDGEYDVVEWFPIGEALRKLSYPNEARVVDRAHQVLTRRN